MQFEEQEFYYYEFSLKREFISPVIGLPVVHQIFELLDKEITGDDIVLLGPSSAGKLTLKAKDQKIIKKVKNFCHYLMIDNILFNLANKHTSNDRLVLESFQKDLKKEYSYFSLNEEIKSKSENNSKKLKI